MIIVVLTFLFLSVYFYLLLGGADFGVGILEFFSSSKNRNITKSVAYRIIGPVWEANHIWLILCIVILWIAFPQYYYLITTQLHLPLTLLLIGIIARGTAFVFRHYDAYKDGTQKIYDRIFEASSVLTPLIIGICAGTVLSGEMIHPELTAGKSFPDLYLFNWLSPFALLTGVFVATLMAYISAVFLVGETQGEERTYYFRKARRANIIAVVAGAAVLVEAVLQDRAIAALMFDHWVSPLAIVSVSLSLFPLWQSLKKGYKNTSRVILAGQVAFILLAWAGMAFPNLILLESGTISILHDLPPGAVINSLGGALLFASVLVLPGLYHLFKTFGLLKRGEP